MSTLDSITPSQASTPSTMEARLLCLNRMGSPFPDNQGPWFVTNGTGVAITQIHIAETPPSFFTTDAAKKEIIERLTSVTVEELGWSEWQLHRIGEIEHGHLPGGAWGQMATVMIVRNRLVTSGHSAQPPGPTST